MRGHSRLVTPRAASRCPASCGCIDWPARLLLYLGFLPHPHLDCPLSSPDDTYTLVCGTVPIHYSMSPTLNVKGKESGTARVLGSGTSGELFLVHLLPWSSSVACRSRGTLGVPPRGYHCEATNEQQVQGEDYTLDIYICIRSYRLKHALRPVGDICGIESHHFPGACSCTSATQAPLPLPWSRLCCWLQGHPADIQIRRPTLLQ